MEVIHGRNLIVRLNGTAIAGARSCDINISGEEIDVASVTQSKWREFITGRDIIISIDRELSATGKGQLATWK